MKILLAIDESRFAQVAAAAVLSRLGSEETDVCVLHVVEPLQQILSDVIHARIPDMDAVRQAQLRQGEELVRRVAEGLRAAGLKVTTAVAEGDPKIKIVDHADEWGADLIVVGSHGRRGRGRLLLGSVSAAVARHAHCSVQIVRLPVDRPAREGEMAEGEPGHQADSPGR